MSNNFYRSDGWVKSPLGPAIPGAQIYVCSQPANVATAPPSPLVAVYSDSGGLVPITQPIITDGYGHYDFYTLPGTYTVVVAFGGVIQDVLPDQSIGNVGSGGGPISLLANGVQLSSQYTLNLTGSGATTVTDEGSGTVQIASTNGPVSGQNVWPAAANAFAANNFAQGAFGGNTCANCLPGRFAYCLPASWKVTFQPYPGNTTKIDACTIAVTAADSAIVTSVTTVKFGGSGSINFTAETTSDPINLQISLENDYYLLIYYDSTTGDPGYWQDWAWTGQNFGAIYSSVNNTSPANILTTHTPTSDPYCFFKKITVT